MIKQNNTLILITTEDDLDDEESTFDKSISIQDHSFDNMMLQSNKL